jgi:hypothetical protein
MVCEAMTQDVQVLTIQKVAFMDELASLRALS